MTFFFLSISEQKWFVYLSRNFFFHLPGFIPFLKMATAYSIPIFKHIIKEHKIAFMFYTNIFQSCIKMFLHHLISNPNFTSMKHFYIIVFLCKAKTLKLNKLKKLSKLNKFKPNVTKRPASILERYFEDGQNLEKWLSSVNFPSPVKGSFCFFKMYQKNQFVVYISHTNTKKKNTHKRQKSPFLPDSFMTASPRIHLDTR